MDDEPFWMTYSHWLTNAASAGPLIVMLVIGLVVCHRFRMKRPRVSRVLRRAMVAELIWIILGSPTYYLILDALQVSKILVSSEMKAIDWIAHAIVYQLPASMVFAVIWGTALWAVLGIDDWNSESSTSTNAS